MGAGAAGHLAGGRRHPHPGSSQGSRSRVNVSGQLENRNEGMDCSSSGFGASGPRCRAVDKAPGVSGNNEWCHPITAVHEPGFKPPAGKHWSPIHQCAFEAVVAKNHILENGSGVALGDVDGDRKCDIYFCRLEGPNVLYRNLGDWKFEDVTASAGVACDGQWSTGAVFADVDGDGDLDLSSTALGEGPVCFSMTVTGTSLKWLGVGCCPVGGSHSMALADVDDDGDLDLYVANYRTTSFKGRLSRPRSGFAM